MLGYPEVTSSILVGGTTFWSICFFSLWCLDERKVVICIDRPQFSQNSCPFHITITFGIWVPLEGLQLPTSAYPHPTFHDDGVCNNAKPDLKWRRRASPRLKPIWGKTTLSQRIKNYWKIRTFWPMALCGRFNTSFGLQPSLASRGISVKTQWWPRGRCWRVHRTAEIVPRNKPSKTWKVGKVYLQEYPSYPVQATGKTGFNMKFSDLLKEWFSLFETKTR